MRWKYLLVYEIPERRKVPLPAVNVRVIPCAISSCPHVERIRYLKNNASLIVISFLCEKRRGSPYGGRAAGFSHYGLCP